MVDGRGAGNSSPAGTPETPLRPSPSFPTGSAGTSVMCNPVSVHGHSGAFRRRTLLPLHDRSRARCARRRRTERGLRAQRALSLPLVVLAAGRSTRFGTLKQVAPVGPGGGSILAYTTFDALRAGFDEVRIVTRPEIEAEIDAHLRGQLGEGCPIRFVHQEEALGTGHAVLLAMRRRPGPVAVANGDDFYGLVALERLRGAMDSLGEAEAGMISFPLESTLASTGGVSRGIVTAGPDGEVERVAEYADIQRVGTRIVGRPAPHARALPGRPRPLEATIPVSMNLWALGAEVRALLETRWSTRVIDPKGDGEAGASGPPSGGGAEFALSTELDRLRDQGALRIRIAGRGEGWFGLTFAGDLPEARTRLEALHASDAYPLPLSRAHPERS